MNIFRNPRRRITTAVAALAGGVASVGIAAEPQLQWTPHREAAPVAERLDADAPATSSSSSAGGTPGTSVASRGGRCSRCRWITSSRPRPWNGGSPVIIANITRPTQ